MNERNLILVNSEVIMKKLILFLLFVLSLVGCAPISNTTELIIFSMNDLHGAVFSSEGNLSRIGNYLVREKAKKPDQTLILSAGDMLQGTAISNLSRGAVIIESMNTIGFDAMTIGNHEFDWGVSVIEDFKDGMCPDADFPFLAANIYEKATNTPVSWAQPYTIIERGNLKIGVIGIIGQSLTYAISPSIIAPYEFKDELPIVMEHARNLRVEQGVDVVIVSAHANTQTYNQNYADLSGDYQIDAMLNGHTHSNYYGETMGNDGIVMPYIQSGSSGRYIGKIVLQLEDKRVVSGSATNIRVTQTIAPENQALNAIINTYQSETEVISGEVIGVSGTTITRTMGTVWAANVIKQYGNKEIGLINTGGIRSDAFPIETDETITVGHVWAIMPFDNMVKTVNIRATDIVNVASRTSIQLSSNARIVGSVLYVDNQPVDAQTVFSVATIDYLFDNTDYPFLSGTDPVLTGDLFRDYLIDSIRTTCATGDKWFAQIQG